MAAPAGAGALIASPDRRRCLWPLLAAALGLLTCGVSALEVYTPKEIFVANGTQGKLTCKFKSTNSTGTLTSVSWSFQPEGTDTTVSFFHYSQGQVYAGNYPPFKDRISWAGDLDKKDASINIENMQFIHNGTYICDVKNPPDIVVQPGHIRLYVVEKEILPAFPVWVVVGIVTAVVLGLTLLITMILAVLYRRRNSKRDYAGCNTSENVSPVKQVSRKSPSDTEGLVKSLPSGSHQPVLNLRDLGLSELKVGQIDQLVDSLLPGFYKDKNVSSHWHTSHVSAQSFFENKYGCLDMFSTLRSSCLYRQHSRTLKRICSDLQYWPVFIQSRGFKTLKSRTRRLQSTSERLAETQHTAPSFVKGFLLRDRGSDVESLDKLMKTKNIPEAHQDAFKTGFAEGFLKAQALTQKTNDSLRRTRLIVFILLVVGIYGLLKNPFLSVRFRTTTGLDSAVDPVQMKNVTFEHVKGVEEAKQELQEVVEFLKNPQKFTVLGGKLPKGILLVGPPGTGKTLLARAVAGEADVPFYYASGSEFDEMFVGVGASRIRNLFREAKANAPCVIFIDELDSVGGKRIESPMHPYSRQTINQLLAEMDGFKPNEGVIIIGATNFPEALDNALIRPGRFDMQVTVPRPDVKGRTEILKWYLNKIKFDQSVDPEIIARGTVGFSGAELENLVNQAALKAAVDGKEMVTMKELEFSKDKILMGPERRSVEIDNKNKTITAYHESGHAIIAYYTKDAMPINKATIMPRGPTLGHVSLLPENDRWNETRAQLLAQMDVSMGGRVAEELIFGSDHITTGASSDFDNATKIAKRMVTKFGMSEKLGVMTYSDTGKLSPETQSAIEQEIRILLRDSYERAKHILKTHAKEHKNLAEALLTYETLDAKEIQIVLEGKKLEVR